MNDIVIRAENLGKKYLLGHQSVQATAHHTLRDAASRALRSLGRSAIEMARGRQIVAGDHIEEFWALQDVSFEVRRGDVVGIIGRNGAGKSTLLKILSRITEPSTGWVALKGRVASLLEVGTGFHPELSGRENIFLNGAILGMSRAEVRRKFDEIVAFAEIERFLDTPVKRYSSGMYVRLAFAVAAHLEPEILIVDEVLAVGDAEFQRKCLGKMQDVAGHGRTVLFVSHNLSAVRSLCSKGLLFESGRLSYAAEIGQVVQAFERSFAKTSTGPARLADVSGPLESELRLEAVEVRQAGATASVIDAEETFEIRVLTRTKRALPDAELKISFFRDGVHIVSFFDVARKQAVEQGVFLSQFSIRGGFFAPGIYTIGLGVSGSKGAWFWAADVAAVEFTLESDGFTEWRDGTVRIPYEASRQVSDAHYGSPADQP